MSISPAITSSVIRSASQSLYRSTSPGGIRITRVVSLSPGGRSGSLKDRIMPVGFTQGSQSSPRRWVTAMTAPSRRCAVVP